MLLVLASLSAAYPSEPAPPIAAPELPAEAAAVWAALGSTDRLRARFESVQHRAVLASPLRSTGQLAFSRPDRVRWEVESPLRSVFVLDGAKVSTALPDLDHHETLDLSASPEAGRLVQGLMVWLGGDLDRVARDYELRWIPGPPRTAELTPRDGALAGLLSRIVLTIDGDPPQIRQVVLHEPGGDRTEISLSGFEPGAALPANTFDPP